MNKNKMSIYKINENKLSKNILSQNFPCTRRQGYICYIFLTLLLNQVKVLELATNRFKWPHKLFYCFVLMIAIIESSWPSLDTSCEASLHQCMPFWHPSFQSYHSIS